MYLSKIRIRNFRRLLNVKVDVDADISIFVGANNSGKTSVAQAMSLFLAGGRDRFSFHDISACRWADFEAFANGQPESSLPVMAIDLWFAVDGNDLHRVIDLLPSLEWEGTHVGIRIAFAPQNQDETLTRFQARHNEAQRAASGVEVRESEAPFVASPRTLREYLETEIKREYECKYYVLDVAQFNAEFEPNEGYEPQELLRDQGRTGKNIVNSLIKVDFMHAQRHLSDSAGGSRAEELSRHLSRYYSRNLERHADDYNALRTLAVSEEQLNRHLEQVFAETLRRLAQLGYPGFANPRLMIKSALNPATVMNSQDGAHVHYALDDRGVTLPDKYNGLGFKNLIYMVVELLDLHAQWVAIEDNRPPLHLVFVEEPEAHLHAQLQQVFVNKVLDILAQEEDDPVGFHTQLALTTHSPHILYERGFRPIRYFRRESTGVTQCSRVLNLSEFYQTTGEPSSDFLERYLKLTHCDLFFADAAVFVEGNVERLIMPQMIAKAAPGLRSCYLSVLEIGGAFGHLFRTLIEFLRITTLIITDLDSVQYFPVAEGEDKDDDEIDEAADDGEAAAAVEQPVQAQNNRRRMKICAPETTDAQTSNQMLIQWLPARRRIDELLALEPADKAIQADERGLGAVRVTYPCTVTLNWNGASIQRAGRTLEAAFAFENFEWTQQQENKDLNLRIRNPRDIEDLARRLHEKVHKDSFKKTDFALALLAKNPETWAVPQYIADGLQWLEQSLGVAETNDDEQPQDLEDQPEAA